MTLEKLEHPDIGPSESYCANWLLKAMAEAVRVSPFGQQPPHSVEVSGLDGILKGER